MPIILISGFMPFLMFPSSVRFLAFFCIWLLLCANASHATAAMRFSVEPSYQHEFLELEFSIKGTSETAAFNPFLNYRLQVDFMQDDATFSVPGFYAGDGNAAQTSSDEGGIWKARFTPPYSGSWRYKVSFTRGVNVAVTDDTRVGKPVKKHHGKTGSFEVLPIPASAGGFARSGRLIYKNSHYLHTEDGEPRILFGANSPENFLAFQDIDGTYSYNKDRQYLKTWAAHLSDWKEGDPIWGQGKGKGIIGALNYLASKDMNVVFALLNNIEGDAQDVWPFISHKKKDYTRYDVSKLAQWEIIFSHAEKLGIAMQLAIQEQENQLILDDGDTRFERRLFFREMIARFGHLKNIVWNLGEENGTQLAYWPQGQSHQQRFAMIRYLRDNNPYNSPIVVGTYAKAAERDEILNYLVRFNRFNGISLQSEDINNIHRDIKYWLEKSSRYSQPWLVMQDEIGPYHTGTKSDADDPDHDELRHKVLWGSLLAGATGVEWYFGWYTSPNDLNAEDWRSRENMWEQSAVAKALFESLPVNKMKNTNELTDSTNDFCFSEPGQSYVIYLPEGGSTRLDLRETNAEFTVEWYDPKKGGDMWRGSIATVNGGAWRSIGTDGARQLDHTGYASKTRDRVVLITRR